MTPAEEFQIALRDYADAWPALKPPTHVRVSEGAAAALRIARPGSAPEPWNRDDTPYMVGPMDALGSRLHSAVCFVGPAQSGKTLALGEGWLAHAVTNDPGDMLIVQMTQDKAREYSKQRIDRALKDSPALATLLGRAQDNNTHDKLFRNGMWLKIAWPTASNLSSTSYRYVFCTDYDRVDDDIDGEGDMFTLAGKRTTTFLSRGKLAVESSPGRLIKDPKWQAATSHEGPPVGGIVGIYNRSNRNRHYWKCPHCGDWLQASPGLGLFRMPADDELLQDIRTLNIDRFAEQYARVVCPSSGCIVDFEHRYEMNRRGIWLPDGLTIDGHDRISGDERTSSIAGFWLGGVAAAYTTWQHLIRKHLQALLDYALTGEETALQTTVNTDQGAAYMSQYLKEKAEEKPLNERTDDSLQRYVVPDWARWVGASVDVQGGKRARFVVQVHAHGPDNQEAIIDRYDLTWSKRPGLGTEFAPIDPAKYPEDWDVLTDKVVNATYRTSDPEVNLRVYRSVVDTGGEDGVTENAYAWKRRLRKQGLAQRVILSKGDTTRLEWLVKESEGGGNSGLGAVPFMLLNANKLKDIVDNCLGRATVGAGRYYFPTWLPKAFFDEMQSEVRQPNGKWEQVKTRNEGFDCCYMQKALVIILRGKASAIDYDNPPPWAAPRETNSERVTRDRPVPTPAVAAPKPAESEVAYQRPVSRSGYLA